MKKIICSSLLLMPLCAHAMQKSVSELGADIKNLSQNLHAATVQFTQQDLAGKKKIQPDAQRMVTDLGKLNEQLMQAMQSAVLQEEQEQRQRESQQARVGDIKQASAGETKREVEGESNVDAAIDAFVAWVKTVPARYRAVSDMANHNETLEVVNAEMAK